jgi:hypothetical protein
VPVSRALVTGCNVTFLEGARGLLRSVREFHPDVTCYCLAPDGEVDAVRAGVGDLAEVLAAPRAVRGVPDHWKLQLLAARVFIPSFTAGSVAWVDSDAVMCRPAPELWDVPPGAVNAVRDAVYSLGRMVPPDCWETFARQFGYAKDQPGFNAGVYALRPADWADLPDRYERAVAEGGYPYYPPGFDQALLNALLLPRVNWLPAKFNAHASFEVGVPADVRILHYTDNPKPWMKGFPRHLPGYYYWVRHGEQERRRSRLAAVKLHVLARAPQPLAYKACRKVLTKLGLWKSEVGVSNGTFLPPAPK